MSSEASAVSALAAELQGLHAAYERLVQENGALKRATADHHAVVMENESLRRKLRTKQQAPRPPPSTFEAAAKVHQITSASALSGAPAQALREIHKLKDENKSLQQQVLQLNSLAREKEAEAHRLLTELGQRAPLKEEVTSALSGAMHAARLAKSGRAEAIGAVWDMLQEELTLLCVTAVEDKLQADVRATLERLRSANVRTWMLTGDKLETASIVAQNASLVARHQHFYKVSVRHEKEARKQEQAIAKEEMDKLKAQNLKLNNIADKLRAAVEEKAADARLTAAAAEVRGPGK